MGSRNKVSDITFGDRKLIVKPLQDGSSKTMVLVDAGQLLFSSDAKNREFVEVGTDKAGKVSFSKRLLLVVSMVILTVLRLISTPMAVIGHAIEWLLNFLSVNNGPLGLFLNFITARVKWPVKDTENYKSVIGQLDARVVPDPNHKPGDQRYNSCLAWLAAKLSYENEAFIKSVVTKKWNMEFLEAYNFRDGYGRTAKTQAFMCQDTKSDPNLVVVAFRGTEPFDAYDWCADFDVSLQELKGNGNKGIGSVHQGFMNALGLQKTGWPKEIDPSKVKYFAYYEIRRRLLEILSKNDKSHFIVAGHSLGGALAILFVCILCLHKETFLLERMEGVYTFGQPRVGDTTFAETMAFKLRKYEVKFYRYVYSSDMVPRLPFDVKDLLYKHFGRVIFYDSLYKGKLLRELPNKNYFSSVWAIPSFLIACWELMRAFLLPWFWGRDFAECWFQMFYRTYGLMLPGIPAHGPQDYNNLTRRGSIPEELLELY